MRPDLDAMRLIAERLATQDNAGTADPYYVVYSGDPYKNSRFRQFHGAFLTRDAAEDFRHGQAHNLPTKTFIYVESAHRNPEIRALRRDIPALLAYVAALESERDRLRAALEPFAKVRHEAPGPTQFMFDREYKITAGDFDRAVAALEGTNG